MGRKDLEESLWCTKGRVQGIRYSQVHKKIVDGSPVEYHKSREEIFKLERDFLMNKVFMGDLLSYSLFSFA